MKITVDGGQSSITWKSTAPISGIPRTASKQGLDASSLKSTMQHVVARTLSVFGFPDSTSTWENLNKYVEIVNHVVEL